MIHVDLVDALSGLDDELLDDYLTRRAENRKRLKRRRAWIKGLLSTAACLLVVLSVVAKVRFDRLYPYIPLENSVGDISVRYVPECMVKDTQLSFLPDHSDSHLFEQANYVFSGTVKKIEHIKINFERNSTYHSIVTIEVDHLFRGDDSSVIRVLTPPIINTYDSDNTLKFIREGSYGYFIVQKINNSEAIISGYSSINLLGLADAKALNDYSSFLVYEETVDQFICYDTLHDHADRFFMSLTAYDPKSVYEYIQKMTNTD